MYLACGESDFLYDVNQEWWNSMNKMALVSLLNMDQETTIGFLGSMDSSGLLTGFLKKIKIN